MSVQRNDDGYATAEAAVTVPLLLVVLAVAVAVISSVGAQLRCVDAARAAARVAARDDPDAAARRVAAEIGPTGAEVTLHRADGLVEVRVAAQLRLTRWLPAVQVSGRAVAESERP